MATLPRDYGKIGKVAFAPKCPLPTVVIIKETIMLLIEKYCIFFSKRKLIRLHDHKLETVWDTFSTKQCLW